MSRSSSYRQRNIQRGDPLTARELQVLALVAAGETTPEISKRLRIVENTIKSHLTSVYKKTGSANRVQAARYYLHNYASPAPSAGPPPPAAVTAAALDGTGTGSLIEQQIGQMRARLEQLTPAAIEAQRLQDAIAALEEIDLA
jgi:DNA-binding CsgD family transcriptional regulator